MIAYDFFVISIILFAIGLFGLLLNRKNVIRVLLAIELILLSININFVTASSMNNDVMGWVFSVVVLTLGAAELAIGLAILIVYFRTFGNIDGVNMNKLKG
ncbi:NADH-quinone oxidoreductase subunit NuoK [Anaplasmataceae bacterium AB001_6]|nr:NADH-quinone oxidoreductase subunit NuoK [Anaplasmataceae bacterium AB001_6]